MKFNTEEINRLMHHRRSILPNLYTGEKVNDEIVLHMIENANMAPTHKLTEPWRFVIFKDAGLEKLGEFQAELYKKTSLEAGDFKEDKYINLRHKPAMASHVIAIGMKRDEKERLPEIEEIESVACAVQNMYLTAAAYGVGCYWGTGGITYVEEAKSFFGLNSKDRLLGFFYIGIPRKWPAGKRKPIGEKISWIQ
ncbi:MAG: nitroreductase [Cyclobacteriaceae bacterium]|nr:nitroreductase [Cyclobacteriaceae bacterium]